MANSLAHSKWVCKYHVVFTPKYRRKIDYWGMREDIRDIIRDLCRCKTFLENINRKQALAFGLMATGRRFFYILWKFCRVDFQNRLFMR